jgi:hypothetical protein
MLRKYPRTPHLEGSRLQPGDFDLASVPFAEIAGHFLVVEEKLDGANSAISFSSTGELQLQSRGHYLTGGPREKQFGPLKSWATTVQAVLWPRLTDRYVMYGEWLYAKHTVFYDALPHYFCEFDVFDRETEWFLSTARRRELLAGTPIRSVPVLHTGPLARLADLTALIGPSTCRTELWRDALSTAGPQVLAETDLSDDMEGLYLKDEDEEQVLGRYKWVRASFLTTVLDSGSHWQDRPIVPNLLADPAVLYEAV